MNSIKKMDMLTLKPVVVGLTVGLFGGYGLSHFWRKSGQYFISSVRSITTSTSDKKKKKSLVYTKTGDSGSSSVSLFICINDVVYISH